MVFFLAVLDGSASPNEFLISSESLVNYSNHQDALQLPASSQLWSATEHQNVAGENPTESVGLL